MPGALKARRATATPAALALLALASLGMNGDEVPWPDGRAPDDAALSAEIDDAARVATREEGEAALEAFEPAEAREHITVWQHDIDQGRWSHDDLFRFGDGFFGHEFALADGLGADPTRVTVRRVHTGVRGGIDTFSCAGCHSVGGVDGAGTFAQNALLEGDGARASSAVARNAPAVLGLGFVELLAREMTAELAAARDAAALRAKSSGAAVSVALASKGVTFGELVAAPDGTLDVSKVTGLDRDLVVRPFGWKGTVSSLRRFAEDAARIHFGVQAYPLLERHKEAPAPQLLGNAGPWFDPDGDGLAREIEEGILTSAEVYMALLDAPVVMPPSTAPLRARWDTGARLFASVGCSSCHTRTLPLAGTVLRVEPDTAGSKTLELDLFAEGLKPRAARDVELFSDLRRHDMGPGLADPHPTADGVPPSVFLTRPLWGLAESAPYLHDGRAGTIEDAILAHGGEAQPVRDAYAALGDEDRHALGVFLRSLSRAPLLRGAR